MIAVFGFLLFPLAKWDINHSESISAEREHKIKQELVQSDLKRTDDLCRSECSLIFKRTLDTMVSSPQWSKMTILQEIQKQHSHLSQLIWTERANSLQQSLTVGALNPEVSSSNSIRLMLQKAKKAVDQGKQFTSESVQVGTDTYFILGVPAEGASFSLIGTVHQQLLAEVWDHQMKNLRIVPYPSQDNLKITSVHANTLSPKPIHHPEDNENTSHYHQNQVVVKFNEALSEANISKIQSEIGSSTMKKLGYTYVFESNQLTTEQLITYFKQWNVEYTEPHYLYLTNETENLKTLAKPNDALYARYQWNLPMIETELGWEIGKGSADVIVAVVDTGVDLNHSDLQGRLLAGFNAINSTNAPYDDVGHGTHVTGIIGALINNSEGVAGMSWYNSILPIKVLDKSGAGSTYNVAQGIIWAADHGAKVINLSLGNYASANFLHDAIRYAYDKDVVLIAASGNDNTESPGYPAAYPEVFAVAASDSHRNKASFSNYGNYIDVTAPGVNIASTYPSNRYASMSGTSMASPHVSALAAMIRSVNPQLRNTEVMDIMRRTAKDLGAIGKDNYYGYGQIDVMKALQLANPNRISSQTQTKKWPNWLNRQINKLFNI